MINGTLGIYEGKKGFTIKKEGTLDGPTIGEKKYAVLRDLRCEW